MIKLHDDTLSITFPEIARQVRLLVERQIQKIALELPPPGDRDELAAEIESYQDFHKLSPAAQESARTKLHTWTPAHVEGFLRKFVFDLGGLSTDAFTELAVKFQRTMRVPDNGMTYPLPTGLGQLPLCSVDDFPRTAPAGWMQKGGVIMPLARSEALWIWFSSRYRFAVKIGAGMVNLLSGEAWSPDFRRQPQNYLVAPGPPWGENDEVLRRYVALPFGTVHPAEDPRAHAADRDASEGTVEALEKIVAEVRRRLPKARMIVRGDSGFCREAIMAWCEEKEEVYYVLGLARNGRLEAMLAPTLAQARARHCLCGGQSTRVFAELRYRTLDSWSRERRVVGKAEVTAQGNNPRFIVTNLPAKGFAPAEGERFAAQALYEEVYCGRGEMENEIKQLQLDLHAARMSTHHLGSNQLRLWLSAFAYLLLERLRAIALTGTELARATLGSVRLRILKVAAQVQVSVRRVHVRLASAYPLRRLFALCHQRLMALPVASG